MSRVFTIAAGRRSKFVVLAVWVAVIFAGFAFDLPGKFADAEENDSSSFLPGDAESTQVLDVTSRFEGGEVAPTVVVFRRADGLTTADQRTIEQTRAELSDATRQFENTTPFSEPQVSEDGTTALLINEIRGTGEGDAILDPIEEYRSLTESEDGLEVAVGGPAGLSADAITVFEGINGTLLAAAGGLVIVLLILIYRSPIFWFFPILAVGFAELATRSLGYGLTELGVTVNGQSSSILSVLVIGAGTDYALLLVSRYREELRRHEDRHEAMALALRTAGPAIFASGLTVAAALLSLTLAEVNGTAGLGPVGALGIAVAILSMLTFLPAILLVVGRRPFWPFIPHFGDTASDESRGVFRRLGDRIARRPGAVAAVSTIVLLIMAAGLVDYSNGLTQSSSFRDEVETVEAQELTAAAFPPGQSAPTQIVAPADADLRAIAAAASEVPGVEAVSPRPVDGDESQVVLNATLSDDPYSTEAYDVIGPLRDAVRSVEPEALVGGPTATEYDLREASARDTRLLIPIALAIVLLILIGLLRSIVAPLLLIATVVLSFAAAIGVSTIVFDVVFGFPGADPSLPLFGFIFLVALGVDYNIFLMTRVREETLVHGSREGTLRGLAVTGSVITAAGVVLAGTFAVLAVLPLVFLTEIGFIVAFGVLLDTFLVRSVLVPALVLKIGPKIWWPSKLAREREPERPGPA
ncbi:MMPL family transporter [Thermoleophilia bacterium SCSIO 60948]|nr:MMPL family transporter [Thermoleophilia bacterium SCSIO 60948]